MPTKRAKERTAKTLIRAGREAAQIEAERDMLVVELAQVRATATDLALRLDDANARVQQVEDVANERFRERKAENERLREQVTDIAGERDGWAKQAGDLQLQLAQKSEALSSALSERDRATKMVVAEAEKLSEEKTKKLRRRVAELKAEGADTTSRFHRACSILAKYERDTVTALFNEGRRSLREIQGRTAE